MLSLPGCFIARTVDTLAEVLHVRERRPGPNFCTRALLGRSGNRDNPPGGHPGSATLRFNDKLTSVHQNTTCSAHGSATKRTSSYCVTASAPIGGATVPRRLQMRGRLEEVLEKMILMLLEIDLEFKLTNQEPLSRERSSGCCGSRFEIGDGFFEELDCG
ncbi:hypothetical protein QAD02_017020 [Eretmocerus hayati]|uniref:Uncharacterized protein n=1 Tax=Eretmocerus hayati TaxID=131215 RepID=A0ACC2PCS4_9HYME|nr:hypothetical protein QAD02_017020 [Eretmocerus hayati]